MGRHKDSANMFAIPDCWQSSTDLDEAFIRNGKNPLFALDVSVDSYRPLLAVADEAYTLQDSDVLPLDHVAGAGFFKLPSVLQDSVLEEPERETGLHDIQPSHPEPEGPLSVSEQDIWLTKDDGLVQQPQYRSWDNFDQVEPERVSSLLITEAGAAALDALVAPCGASIDTDSDVVDDALYCACLLNLVLGRSSVLFSWDAETAVFVKTAAELRTSGLTLQSVQSIDRLCLDCANAIKDLQAFAETSYSTPSTPTRVALAGVVDRLLLAVQSELGVRSRRVRSILQLQSIVRPVHTVLSYFQKLVEKLTRHDSEEGMLSELFKEVQSTEYRDSLLHNAVSEVFLLTSKPWTDFVEEWIGLKAEDGTAVTKRGPGKGFVKVGDRMWVDDLGVELEEPDYFLDETRMPSFIPNNIAQAIFETGRNLRFLREHHPEHPLSGRDIVTLTNPPSLEWQFDWDSIKRLETKVDKYRDAVSLVIQQRALAKAHAMRVPEHGDQEGYELELFGKSDEQVAANVLASMDQLNQPLDSHRPHDRLAILLRNRLYQGANEVAENESFSPHWSLIPLLSFGPIIDAQSTLVNQECMRLLFSAHDLRVHLDLLKQCYLMGNGLLCSRLSHALFDTELETAQRKAGVALGGGVMGLRLGGRENWPPASSELRLALMGVLSDSYQTPPREGVRGDGLATTFTPASRSHSSDLPGDLSFAVRDMSPEEIDRCMDPDGLEALDFLQLSYRPPSALRPVITPVVLVKNDRVFRFLLRILRMLYIVNQQLFHKVPRHEQKELPSNASVRFRIEARHFVSQMAAYFFAIGITASWTRFELWLDDVEADLFSVAAVAATSGSGTTAAAARKKNNYSPDWLQKRQEQVVDDIMLALLLRKRQLPVLKLLEEIFGVILRFSKQLRLRAAAAAASEEVQGLGDQRDETPEMLYAEFRKKVEVFLTVCRGLGEKKTSRADNPIETLVSMLDLSGFYARRT
ncbi:Spc98 family-domain-containing protein [Apodospora peruviana]|uniref:Spindle pole body component n=1 Tax=Apodospora peruviana TaxID=516989 RepID=A0AAE0I4B3_9PEZI|nr:Spc98 family-domain-containing protein [Apodospora peruviana]